MGADKVTTGKEQDEFNEMAATISWGKKNQGNRGSEKGQGKGKRRRLGRSCQPMEDVVGEKCC